MTDIDPTAKRLLEDFTDQAARRSGLPEPARTDARLELHSHLYDIASETAQAAGRPIETDDVRQAIGALGTPEHVDDAFFAPKRARLERAEFTPRTIAYVIDFVLGAMVVQFIASPIMALLLFPFLLWTDASCGFDLFDAGCGPTTPWFMVPILAIWPLVTYAVLVGAYAAFEVTRGQTPGKMVMKLRATSRSGGPMTWRAAILRNLTKGFPPLAFVDALLGHLSDARARERISDRYAETAVIREVDA